MSDPAIWLLYLLGVAWVMSVIPQPKRKGPTR